MTIPEFIYIDEHAVRVTSWRHDRGTGSIEFVVIARGDQDRDLLLDSFSHEPVMVRVGTEPAVPMDVHALETTTPESGPRAIHRMQVKLAPEGTPRAAREPEPEKPQPPGNKIDQIIELLTEIRDELRHIRENANGPG